VEVGRHLRQAGIAATTVRIKLRWPDFTTLTRQTSLSQPTDQDEEIYHLAIVLLGRVREKGRAVRLIGVGVSGLTTPLRQLGLWDVDSEKSRRLQEAMDMVRKKYGEKAIRRGNRNRE
jgi:DNA polymerase-4